MGAIPLCVRDNEDGMKKERHDWWGLLAQSFNRVQHQCLSLDFLHEGSMKEVQ